MKHSPKSNYPHEHLPNHSEYSSEPFKQYQLGRKLSPSPIFSFLLDGYPLYVTHADGAYVFDVDGNRYVDLVGALCPVILGYSDPDVNAAIRTQLDKGISFSLSTELEVELAETLTRLIPCAEMVKFGKNGTDVTTAAVRLARAYTGRDHVLVGGYHGWADWSMSLTNRNQGNSRRYKRFISTHRIRKDPLRRGLWFLLLSPRTNHEQHRCHRCRAG